ncbi:MAG: PIG-L family deacetylase, partial [Propionibacteriales bacterium]|nr:PIG-L family deacetylase [Propionibacteriales bacterium]
MSVRSQVTPDSVFAAQWAARMQRAPGVRPRDVMGVTPGDVVVVVGAHPDDETLGFGASIASLSEAGIEVHAVTMSSGEAALD